MLKTKIICVSFPLSLVEKLKTMHEESGVPISTILSRSFMKVHGEQNEL